MALRSHVVLRRWYDAARRAWQEQTPRNFLMEIFGDVRSPISLMKIGETYIYSLCLDYAKITGLFQHHLNLKKHPPSLKLWMFPILKKPSTGSISSPRDLVFMMWEWEGQQKHISRFFLLNHNSVKSCGFNCFLYQHAISEFCYTFWGQLKVIC